MKIDESIAERMLDCKLEAMEQLLEAADNTPEDMIELFEQIVAEKGLQLTHEAMAETIAEISTMNIEHCHPDVIERFVRRLEANNLVRCVETMDNPSAQDLKTIMRIDMAKALAQEPLEIVAHNTSALSPNSLMRVTEESLTRRHDTMDADAKEYLHGYFTTLSSFRLVPETVEGILTQAEKYGLQRACEENDNPTKEQLFHLTQKDIANAIYDDYHEAGDDYDGGLEYVIVEQKPVQQTP